MCSTRRWPHGAHPATRRAVQLQRRAEPHRPTPSTSRTPRPPTAPTSTSTPAGRSRSGWARTQRGTTDANDDFDFLLPYRTPAGACDPAGRLARARPPSTPTPAMCARSIASSTQSAGHPQPRRRGRRVSAYIVNGTDATLKVNGTTATRLGTAAGATGNHPKAKYVVLPQEPAVLRQLQRRGQSQPGHLHRQRRQPGRPRVLQDPVHGRLRPRRRRRDHRHRALPRPADRLQAQQDLHAPRQPALQLHPGAGQPGARLCRPPHRRRRGTRGSCSCPPEGSSPSTGPGPPE